MMRGVRGSFRAANRRNAVSGRELLSDDAILTADLIGGLLVPSPHNHI
jgi:hypothetical protein